MACQSNNLARAQSKFPPPPPRTLNPPAGFPPLRPLLLPLLAAAAESKRTGEFFPHLTIGEKPNAVSCDENAALFFSCEGGFELDLSGGRRGSPGSRRRPRRPGRTCFHRRALLYPAAFAFSTLCSCTCRQPCTPPPGSAPPSKLASPQAAPPPPPSVRELASCVAMVVQQSQFLRLSQSFASQLSARDWKVKNWLRHRGKEESWRPR